MLKSKNVVDEVRIYERFLLEMNAPTFVGAFAMISTTFAASIPNNSNGNSCRKFDSNKSAKGIKFLLN